MFFKKWFKRRRCLQTTSRAYTTETVMLLSLRYRADKIRNLSRRSREARRRIPQFAIRNFSVSSMSCARLRESSFLLKFFSNSPLTTGFSKH